MQDKVEPKFSIKQYKGLYFREKTSDKSMIKESYTNYASMKFDENSVVVDFGGNIGAFGKIALDGGCKELHIFEPETTNFDMIYLNLMLYSFAVIPPRIRFYKTAVSTSNEPELVFYQNDSGNKDCSGTVTPVSKLAVASRKIRTTVANRNINEVLSEIKPTHLKVDIEGAEISWIREIKAEFPDSVQELALEIHRDPKEEFFYEFDKVWYPKICEKFEPIFVHPNSGFKNEKNIILPNMGINIFGRLFGIDLVFRRRL